MQHTRMHLNDGTYASQAAIDILQQTTRTTDLRFYSDGGNNPLKEAIAEADRVTPDHVFLHHGSGPILKLCIPRLIRKKIVSSPFRILKHLARRNAFPIVTPALTYNKVWQKGSAQGIRTHFLKLDAPNFDLDAAELSACLDKQDAIVYLVNPNNPTGNILLQRQQILELATRYPGSYFWIDEAYVQYLDTDTHPYCGGLVTETDNLFVSRSFSFAYGLAGLRIGYLLAPPAWIRDFDDTLTEHRIGLLQEKVAIAALQDNEHLPFLRKSIGDARQNILEAADGLSCLKLYPSQANFIFGQMTEQTSAQPMKDWLRERGILIKTFESSNGQPRDTHFRITIGLPEENERLIETLTRYDRERPTSTSSPKPLAIA